jgi:hypothetical protein
MGNMSSHGLLMGPLNTCRVWVLLNMGTIYKFLLWVLFIGRERALSFLRAPFFILVIAVTHGSGGPPHYYWQF